MASALWEQRTPFDVGIAQYTGIGCSACHDLRQQSCRSRNLQTHPDVDDKMVKTHLHRHLTAHRWWSPDCNNRVSFWIPAVGIVPGFHGNAHHFITFFMKQHGGYGTIYTSAHGNQNPSSVGLICENKAQNYLKSFDNSISCWSWIGYVLRIIIIRKPLFFTLMNLQQFFEPGFKESTGYDPHLRTWPFYTIFEDEDG